MTLDKNKILVLWISISLLFLSSCWSKTEIIEISSGATVNIENWTGNIKKEPEKVVTISLIWWLWKSLTAFNNIYKKALFNTWKLNEEWVKQTEQALEEWNELMNKFVWKKVVWYQKTEKLDNKLEKIGKFISEANTFVSEWNMPEAHEKLEHVRKEIRKIRQENWVKSISDDMLTVHDIMETIVDHKWDKNLAEFDEINIWIEALERFNIWNNEYEEMLLSFKNIVIELSKLEWEDYTTKLKELKPKFIKIYMKFG